jgi:TatD DNase family protein
LRKGGAIDYTSIKSGIVDSHAHVVSQYFPEDQQSVIERSLKANVRQIVNPGVDVDSIPELISLSEKHDHIYIGVGVHPHEADTWTQAAEAAIRKACQHPKVVAIGECGLDFYYKNSSEQAQLHAFIKQIQIAKDFGKPLIIHCRDAFDQLKEILKAEAKGVRGVLHCFTGSPTTLSALGEFDFYVSFSGIVTFPNAKDIQAAAPLVKQERLLVETDCPFLAPQKMRGKRNEPAFVWMVAEKLAELRSVSLDEIARTCSKNARELFGLPEPES